MISLKNISVTFASQTPLEKKALQQINLQIEKGSFISVIGSNGAGKSTLLNVLAGEIRPSSGDIFIDDRRVTTQKTWQRANAVARVFQDPLVGSCGLLTVEENLSLAFKRGKKRGLHLALNATRRGFFQEKLAQLNIGLEDRMKTRMDQLSGGQRQAVSLIMASLIGSQLLLLDEHTAALDPHMAQFIMNLTHELVENACLTTLMVTHSMRQALDYGTRTLMMHEGKIILDICGAEREKYTVNKLLNQFKKIRHEEIDEDSFLME